MSVSGPAIGIVGLPNVGKSTLFNALLKKAASAKASAGQAGFAKAANYPFTTIEPNVGVVEVPDVRLEKLADVIEKEGDSIASLQNDKGKRPPIVPAVVKFVDIAGLVKGAAQGEGLGNQFLSHIREVDVIVFVLRDFKNENIIRAGSEEPKEDSEVLKSELLLKDLETVSKRLDTFGRELKAVPPADKRHLVLAAMQKAKELIEQGKWLEESMESEDLEKIADLQLLSTKKAIYVVNSDEGDLNMETSISGALRISAKLEEELVNLSEEEQKEYLKELGIDEPGLNRLIKKAYETLGLASYLTAGAKEVRAWTIKQGVKAPQAAGVIHTDFERGFIAADVIPFEKFVEVGGWQKAKTAGVVRTIGKNEEIHDGDVVEFKFNV